MKIKITILLFTSLILFTSCEYPWSIKESIYVSNETSDSIRIAVFNDVFLNSDYSSYLVEPYMMSNKLTDIEGFFLGGKTIREDATGVVLGILIYHIKDSASIFLNNGYHQDRNEFYKYISTISDIDNKNRIITARTEIKISDSLLQIMTKDTALTDSIFNLK